MLQARYRLAWQVAHLEEARQRMLRRWEQPAEGSQQNLVAELTQASWRHTDGTAMSGPSAANIAATLQEPQGKFLGDSKYSNPKYFFLCGFQQLLVLSLVVQSSETSCIFTHCRGVQPGNSLS